LKFIKYINILIFEIIENKIYVYSIKKMLSNQSNKINMLCHQLKTLSNIVKTLDEEESEIIQDIKNLNIDFSVNEASVDIFDGYTVLRTTARTNLAGAFHGSGIGNKSIMGIHGFNNMPIADLKTISFTWTNVVGPVGTNYSPPGLPTTLPPYINLIVDFGPVPNGGIKVVVMCTGDQLNMTIDNAVTIVSPTPSSVLTYSWDTTKSVMIVLLTGNGMFQYPNNLPATTFVTMNSGTWLENAISWSSLLAANPNARLVDAFPADGGMPAGAIMPAVLLVSGDSETVTKSGKKITAFSVNGKNVLP
jgi:hypothetical protein